MIWQFFKVAMVGNKVIKIIKHFLWKVLYHLIDTVQFFYGRIFFQLAGEVFAVMDSVFFITSIQPDTLCDFFLVEWKMKPRPFDTALNIIP